MSFIVNEFYFITNYVLLVTKSGGENLLIGQRSHEGIKKNQKHDVTEEIQSGF